MNEVIGGIAVKVHFGHELKRSPSSTELNAAEKNKKSAKEQAMVGDVLHKYGIVKETVNAIQHNFNTLDQKVSSVNQKISSLQADIDNLAYKCGKFECVSDDIYMDSNVFKAIASDILMKGKTEVDGNVNVKRNLDAKGNVKLG